MNGAGSFRLAVAQPAIDREAPESSRVAEAGAMIREAGRGEADLILFPESFPGPITAGLDYDAGPDLGAACRDSGVAACWGRVEPIGEGRFVTVVRLTDRTGGEAGRYVRSHPATGDVHPVLSGVPMAPGPEPGIFELDGLRLGIVVCSELWNPELCRVLALRGAEVLLAPAGGGFHSVAENWQLMARARAIENEMFVALTQQLFDGESGSALIAGPEGVLSAGTGPGLVIADLDLERARWLRSQDDSMQEPKPFSSLPGLLRARRPELYGELGAPQEGLYDFEAASS
ncbi:MAG TPA: carbon-nitrogen hydrolase family protein [Solirubrobacterales bacterium]|nr:carbon-nitrogen hydrolase family protein [Solirubrobacterales bacterium]